MRLLQLRFTNINSLAGTWEIDFTNADFRRSPLFAIIGPTGSGKSTILAAVSLAPPEATPMRSFCAPDAFSTLARSLSCTSTLVLSHTITSTASCSSAAKAAS